MLLTKEQEEKIKKILKNGNTVELKREANNKLVFVEIRRKAIGKVNME